MTATVFDQTLVDEIERLVSDGDYVTVLGPERAGKTTLLDQVAERFEARGEHLVVRVDFRTALFDVADKTRFYRAFAGILHGAWDAPSAVGEVEGRFDLKALLDDLLAEDEKRHLLLLLDHVEALKPFLAHSVLKLLRVLFNERTARPEYRRIVSVVAGGVSIYELSRGISSPYNVARVVRVPPFSREQVEELAKACGTAAASAALDRLHTELGGDRFETARTLRLLRQPSAAPQPISEPTVGQALADARVAALRPGSHFRRTMDCIEQAPPVFRLLVEIAREGPRRSRELVTDIGSLELTGLLRNTRDGWVLKAPFWEDLVRSYLSERPVGEVMLLHGAWDEGLEALRRERGRRGEARAWPPSSSSAPPPRRRRMDLVQAWMRDVLGELPSLTREEVRDRTIEFLELALGLERIVIHEARRDPRTGIVDLHPVRATFDWEDWEARSGVPALPTERQALETGRFAVFYAPNEHKLCVPVWRSSSRTRERLVGWVASIYAPADWRIADSAELREVAAQCGTLLDLVPIADQRTDSPVVEALALDQLLGNLGEVAILDEDRTIRWASADVLERFGDVVGQDCHTALGRGDHACDTCPVDEALRTSRSVRLEAYERRDRYGTPGWATISVTPTRLGDWGPVAVVAWTDITLTTRAREILAELERTRDLREASAYLVRSVAEAFRLDRVRLYRRLASPGRYELVAARGMPESCLGLRIPASSGGGRYLDDLTDTSSIEYLHDVFPADILEVLEIDAVVEVLRVPLDVEGRRLGLLTADNRSSGRPVPRWNTQILGHVARGVGQTLASVERRERLEQALSARSDFVSHMAHETRAPLTASLDAIDVLLAGRVGDLSPGQQERLTLVREAISGQLRRTDAILDVARLEHGRPLPGKPRRLDATALLGEVAQELRVHPAIRQKDLEVSARVPTGSVPLVGHERELRAALWGLADNAARFCRRGGTITIACGQSGQRVRIEIADEGPGLAEADLERVLEPFEQAAPATGIPTGLGLGLFLSRRYVELHGGTLRLENLPGRGLRALVELPLAEETP